MAQGDSDKPNYPIDSLIIVFTLVGAFVFLAGILLYMAIQLADGKTIKSAIIPFLIMPPLIILVIGFSFLRARFRRRR